MEGLKGLKSNRALRMHGVRTAREKRKRPRRRGSRGAGGCEQQRLVLQEEAEGGLRGEGLLLDGEVVLAEVGSLVEELTELQPNAEVFADHVLGADAVVVGHTRLLRQTFATVGGGGEAGAA